MKTEKFLFKSKNPRVIFLLNKLFLFKGNSIFSHKKVDYLLIYLLKDDLGFIVRKNINLIQKRKKRPFKNIEFEKESFKFKKSEYRKSH